MDEKIEVLDAAKPTSIFDVSNNLIDKVATHEGSKLLSSSFDNENDRKHRRELLIIWFKFIGFVIVMVGGFMGAFIYGQWAVLTHLVALCVGGVGGFGYARTQIQTENLTPN